MPTITPEDRTAAGGDRAVSGAVTLMNGFQVAPERDEAFQSAWQQTSRYFRSQPGFMSLRLHRAVSSTAQPRRVNVAVWQSETHFRAAHTTEEFRRLVSQDRWQEFPSSPALYEVVTAADSTPER